MEKYYTEFFARGGEVFFSMRDVSTDDSRSFRCDVSMRGKSNILKLNVVGTLEISNIFDRLKWNLVATRDVIISPSTNFQKPM